MQMHKMFISWQYFFCIMISWIPVCEAIPREKHFNLASFHM